MTTLMFSLDRKILEENSKVAERMKLYGRENKLIILIPEPSGISLQISDNVLVVGTGGNKLRQFFRLIKFGRNFGREHSVSLVTTQDPFMTGLVGLIISKTQKIQLEIQTHGDFYSSDYYRKSSIKNLLYYLLGKYTLTRADTVRAVGERARLGLMKMGIEESRIRVHPVHIDIDQLNRAEPKFDLRASYRDADNIFISIGRFEKVKNITWLVDVWQDYARRHPRDILLLIGDGSKRADIEGKIKKYNLDKSVFLLGWQDDIISFMRGATALLFPSLSEGYGLVVIEAMAVGCPVVMTDVGVANFEVKESDMVRIVNVGDKDGFLTEMESFVN